jgi:hypothetical protein
MESKQRFPQSLENACAFPTSPPPRARLRSLKEKGIIVVRKTRIDSRFLLPVRSRCLMKMLPVNHGVADEEAIEPDDTK